MAAARLGALQAVVWRHNSRHGHTLLCSWHIYLVVHSDMTVIAQHLFPDKHSSLANPVWLIMYIVQLSGSG